MDYNAINTLVSKAHYKDDRMIVGHLNRDTVGITVDGYVMWFIPEKDFLFDITKLVENETDLKRLITTDGYVNAVLTNTLTATEKRTLVTFKAGDIECFVDKKLLKTFDPKLSTYKIKNAVSGVLVYEGEKLVGTVLPVKYNKNNL